jgi:hypothetical protein
MPADESWSAFGLALYFFGSGALAFIVGAAASLIAPVSARLPVWLSVAGIAAVAAGSSYDTSAVRGLRRILGHAWTRTRSS